MEPPMKHKPSAVPINTSEEEVGLQDRNTELVKRRKTGFSGSIVQPQQEIEVSAMENNVPDGLPVEVSTGNDPMDVLTDCAVQSSGEANSRSEGRVRSISFTVNGPARLRLPKICAAFGWKEPSFDFEKQGPPHNILFTCKVTVRLEGLVNTVIECFGDPKPQKKAAQDHAAQGALWCLERFGHIKQSSDA
ncbi:endoribonuclease Dicer homolog 4-like isoform X2 [Panicum virgatum]|nr:endoribonuclease Dicer homolog 4-like isoform X2 [Panicum virgatum]XP_039834781.1 endoribonuclease Dicer homolog 4-like isoform X2 [Panicum virgatum]XP_039834782.1 endoribonuclease Dicer homolog 4-like isoform X2 [Panicum virgatum]